MKWREVLCRMATRKHDKPVPLQQRARRRWPSQPAVGSVVVFWKRFPGTSREYSYAALRAPNGNWYLTGTHPLAPMTWQELTRFIDNGRAALAVGWVDFP